MATVTPKENAEFEKQLKTRGWRYDADSERFYDAGNRVLESESLIDLLPDRHITLDELAAYRRERFSLRATKY